MVLDMKLAIFSKPYCPLTIKTRLVCSEDFSPQLYSNPKSFVNFLLPPLERGGLGWGKKFTTHLELL